MKAITIWTCRQVSDEPDREDLLDSYHDMPERAFRTLKGMLTHVHKDMMERYADFCEGEPADDCPEPPTTLEALVKTAENFFKGDPNASFYYTTTTCTMWIVQPITLS